jgi:hypothetical protein
MRRPVLTGTATLRIAPILCRAAAIHRIPSLLIISTAADIPSASCRCPLSTVSSAMLVYRILFRCLNWGKKFELSGIRK